MPFLPREPGVEIYYEVHQPQNAHRKGTILLTHGFSSTSAMWRGQIPSLVQQGHYKLILWDMRGHGQSSYPEEQDAYSEEKTVEDMRALLDEVEGVGSGRGGSKEWDGEKVVVGGLSLGGYMSLGFYRVYGERVGKLLIIDTGPGFKSPSARASWNKTALRTAENLLTHGLPSPTSPSSSPEVSSPLVHHRNALGLSKAARGMLTQKSAAVINSLPDIKVPALVVVGAEDTPYLNAAGYMASKIPWARKVVVDGAGHAVNIDQPGRFNEVVLDFLQEGENARL